MNRQKQPFLIRGFLEEREALLVHFSTWQSMHREFTFPEDLRMAKTLSGVALAFSTIMAGDVGPYQADIHPEEANAQGSVGIASRRSRHTYRADQRTARFDDQSSANNDHAGQVANTCLHHAGLTDREKTARAVAEGRRRPRLTRGGCGRVRSRKAITQDHLHHTEAIDNRYRHLIAPFLAVHERGLRQF